MNTPKNDSHNPLI